MREMMLKIAADWVEAAREIDNLQLTGPTTGGLSLRMAAMAVRNNLGCCAYCGTQNPNILESGRCDKCTGQQGVI